MKLADIYGGLITRYVAGNFGLTTFYPNKDGNPTAAEKHARVWFLPAQNDAASLGGSGFDRMSGILQIDLMYPTDEGIGDILGKADEIAAYFQRGQDETYNTFTVRMTGTTVTAVRNEEGWMRAIVSVGWYAHVARSVT